MARRAAPSKLTERVCQAGTLLNRRYRLLHEIGGNHGVRVYQARDEREGEKLVAVKIIPETLLSSATRRDELPEEVRLVQAAAHPNLVQVQGLERSTVPAAMFLVEEWLAGFTLRDFLAGRGGALPVAEALRLLEQTATASDHAATCRLEPLELALTELYITFPALAASASADSQVRALLPKSTAEWPDWTLKTHAFRISHDPLALDTWAGGATLVPTGGPSGPRPGDAGALKGGQTVQALAKVFYELLGGMPVVSPHRTDPRQIRYAALPVLNEEGNALLRQTLSGASGYIHGWQLHAALARAIGNEPTRGDARLPVARPETPSATGDGEAGADGGGLAGERSVGARKHLDLACFCTGIRAARGVGRRRIDRHFLSGRT